jgi:hypothetical protein
MHSVLIHFLSGSGIRRSRHGACHSVLINVRFTGRHYCVTVKVEADKERAVDRSNAWLTDALDNRATLADGAVFCLDRLWRNRSGVDKVEFLAGCTV